MNYKYIIVFLILLLCVGSVSAVGGYNKTYTHNITGNAYNLYGYLIMYEVYNTSGVTVNNTIYTNGSTKGDWSDIKFMDGNDTKLDYFIEESSAIGNNANIWVRYPSIPSATNVTTKIYFGNATDILSTTPGKQMFTYYDDFNTGSNYNTSLYSFYVGTFGCVTTSNGALNVSQSSYTVDGALLYTSQTFNVNTEFRGMVNATAVDQNFFGFNSPGATLIQSYSGYGGPGGHSSYTYNNYITLPYDYRGKYSLIGAKHNTNSNYDWYYVNNTYMGRVDNSGASSSDQPLVFRLYGAAQSLITDWALVKTISYPEPTHSSYLGLTPPTANFSANRTVALINTPIGFNDSSTGSPTSWYWDFGDGNASTWQNITYSYPNVGNYTVSLIATNSGGSNTMTRTNYINITSNIPISSFTANTTKGPSPLIVGFTDTSSPNGTVRNWTFGRLNTSTLQNPTHTFTGVGLYNVSLLSTGSGGAKNYSNVTYYINVTAASVNANANMFINNTRYSSQVGQNTTITLFAGNITGMYVSNNISFNPYLMRADYAVGNTTSLLGSSSTYYISNTQGFILVNTTLDSGNVKTIGTPLLPISDIKFTPLNHVNSTVPINYNSNPKIVYDGVEDFLLKKPTVMNVTNNQYTFNLSISSVSGAVTTLSSVVTSGANVSPLSAQTGTGNVNGYTSDYGAVLFNITSVGYYTLTQQFLIDSNGTYTVSMIPLSGTSGATSTDKSTWNTPRQAIFKVVDQTGKVIPNVTVSAVFDASTFPESTENAWLLSMYGVDADAANQMVNGTLIMSGVSGIDGTVVFTMLPSLGYTITASNPQLGISSTVNKLYPSAANYNIWVTPTNSFNPLLWRNNLVTKQGNTSLLYTETDEDDGIVGMVYQDISGQTTRVAFNITCVNNNTLIYSSVYSGFGSSLISENYNLHLEDGKTYKWGYYYTRTV